MYHHTDGTKTDDYISKNRKEKEKSNITNNNYNNYNNNPIQP